MKTIEITDDVYKSLANLIVGFEDTPNSVIERLLNAFENKEKKPELVFYPEDEVKFKKLLMRDKKAEVTLFKKDGNVEISVWQATKIHDKSNLRANIWSGHLRNWKEKGVIKADFYIYERPTDTLLNRDFFTQCETLSPLLNVPYRFLIELEFEQTIQGPTGAKNLVIQLHDGQDLSVIQNNPYFDASSKRIVVPQSAINYPLD